MGTGAWGVCLALSAVVAAAGAGSSCTSSGQATCGSSLLQWSGTALEKGVLSLTEEGTCDEASWPDKDHGLVCGHCKVLVNRFDTVYKSCSGYCAAVNRSCVGAWEERNDACAEKHEITCEERLASTDAICQCSVETKVCYGELDGLAVEEGSAVGQRLFTTSPSECKAACNGDDQCESFSFCPQWYGCWMKDKSFSGNEATKAVGACKTYHKQPCGGAAGATSATHTDLPSIRGSSAAATAPPSSGTPLTLKVMSYNTEYRDYKSRVLGYAMKIREVGAGTVGTQECQDKDALARISGYRLVPDTGFQNPILFNPSKVSFVYGSSGWVKIPRDSHAERTITWAQFRLGTAVFWHFNTHLPHNQWEASSRNTHSRIAQLLLQKRAELGAGGAPTVVTGDMNPFASHGASEGSFESTLRAAGFQKAYEARGSPGYGGLDKIFASAHWTPSNGADHGTGGSDHPAIAVDLTLKVPK